MKTLQYTFTVLLVFFFSGLTAQHLDQAQVITTSNVGSSYAYQTFKAGGSGNLDKIELKLSNWYSTAVTATLKIHMGSGTSGTAIYTGSVSIPGSTNGWLTFNTTGAVPLTGGNMYTIALSNASGTFNYSAYYNNNTDGTNEDPYADGTMSGNPNMDMGFKTYLSTVPTNPSIIVPGVRTTSSSGGIGIVCVPVTVHAIEDADFCLMQGRIVLDAALADATILSVGGVHTNVTATYEGNNVVYFNTAMSTIPTGTTIFHINVDLKTVGKYYFRESFLTTPYNEYLDNTHGYDRFVTKYSYAKANNWFHDGNSSARTGDEDVEIIDGMEVTSEVNYTTRLEDIKVAPSVAVYPNPVKLGTNIQLELTAFEAGELQFQLNDILGRTIYTTNIMADGNGKQLIALDIPPRLSSGLFFFVLTKEQKLIQTGEVLVR